MGLCIQIPNVGGNILKCIRRGATNISSIPCFWKIVLAKTIFVT